MFWAIDTNCIDINGIIKLKRYVNKETYAKRTQQLIPQEGDLVFSREGTIGLVAVLPPNSNICLGQRVMLIRPGSGILPEYLRIILTSQSFLAQFINKGTGAKHINVGDIRKGLIAIPPTMEQQRIINTIKETISII